MVLTKQRSTETPELPSHNLIGIPIIAVIGVGYVGQHLVDLFSSRYGVIGYDVSPSRVEQLRREYRGVNRITISNDPETLKVATHFLISVPTCLGPNNTIDLSHMQSALKIVERYARPRSIVVIESTVAVGTTRALLGKLARSREIYAGMSPERIDPGRKWPPAQAIPKIVSALEDVVPGSQRAIEQLYRSVFENVISVTKPEVAEMTKLYENCQRTIAIAYANEMADACVNFGIDPFEVAHTAASKPFGYLPVFPSPGIGGHCLPVNPVYFMSTSNMPLLQQAHETMSVRPSKVASEVLASILEDNHRAHKPNHRSRVLVVGVGFKPGQSDTSHSPGLQLLRFLHQSEKVDVMFCDPFPSLDYDILQRLKQGYCTSDPRFCSAPTCLFEYGLPCYKHKFPEGFNTSNLDRSHIGDVVYGKRITECKKKGVIALTYDDGPCEWSSDLLDLLKKNGIKATFFVVGWRICNRGKDFMENEYTAIIERIIDEGHQIGSHTWSHKSMDEMSSEHRKRDMLKMELALGNILGFVPTYWRPPFNACKTKECLEDLGVLGYHTSIWDINTKDWAGDYAYAEDQFLTSISSAPSSESSWIAVLHETHERTVHGLTQWMIDRGREQGYEFATMGECMADPEENWYRYLPSINTFHPK
ncbi:carbohydrate esterase family 4 protein [Periconia macrospinosa]|uniref:Carbohydrate esterase family 4 protein n=1 Tax=Periconia macrospinosa TaxID=97972 RepID=A0A2V1E6P8_9PLEO|nr:carbohydrate esterase family 4 protein [Periconia macrospinosa]